MRLISSDQVYALLPMVDCIDIVEAAMIAVSEGKSNLPLRSIMPLGNGNAMGIMPGGLAEPHVHGIKLVSLYPENPKLGLSSHQGIILLFDSRDGRPMAAIDGASVTAQRTAAASAAATRALSRANSRVLAILGAGEQADQSRRKALRRGPRMDEDIRQCRGFRGPACTIRSVDPGGCDRAGGGARRRCRGDGYCFTHCDTQGRMARARPAHQSRRRQRRVGARNR
jgi:hypothetical protein